MTLVVFLHSTNAESADEAHDRFDPSLMVGVESCSDCHDSIVQSWERSRHATSFSDLHSNSLAEDIAALLEIQPLEIRQHQTCARCHFTQEKIHSSLQVMNAVSCESCHGAAADWIDVHNRRDLSRASRVQKATSAGMYHPSNVSETNRRCFDCHVIDVEQLVNVAGHPALSEGFELLSWSQGEVKHNFLIPKPGADIKRNSKKLQPITAAHKRKLFLSGKLMFLSATLHAISTAKDPPVDVDGAYIKLPSGKFTFAVQLAQNAQTLTKEMRKIQEITPNQCFEQALQIMDNLRLETGNSEKIQEASQEIDGLSKRFCEDYTGEEFAAIDPMLLNLASR